MRETQGWKPDGSWKLLTHMDFAAIRSRLADSGGRLYWRSLSELADTPDFREYLHREFPEQASEWNDPKGRRTFLKLMSASLALAGVGACTRQPPEQIVPYIRQPEDLVPGRPLFCERDSARRRGATRFGRKPYGPADQNRRKS
jgi:MoCo/4Fe-4S cofactor protein with predicted Tat translocation signal